MQTKVTDEMITRYLCGQATPEEESTVLDYLSESDEHIDDLLAMTAASQLVDSKAKTPLKRTNIIRISLAVAASIALVVCITAPFWRSEQTTPSNFTATKHTLHTEEAPHYASCDTINDEI